MTTFNKFDRCGSGYSELPLHVRKEDTAALLEDHRKFIKMTKTRAAILLVLIIVVFALIFSPSDAYPTVEPADDSNGYHLSNGSRLAITNVVKTIEFEVGVIDDDDVTDNNFTSFNNSGVYETDIQLLNIGLLKELVNKAEEAEENDVETTEETLSTAAQT